MKRNKVWWEVWDWDTGNMIGDFRTRREAIAYATELGDDIDVLRNEQTGPGPGDFDIKVVFGPRKK